jgi:hypothetical protein
MTDISQHFIYVAELDKPEGGIIKQINEGEFTD